MANIKPMKNAGKGSAGQKATSHVILTALLIGGFLTILAFGSPTVLAITTAEKTARCSVVITINIEVSGPDASQELVDRWKREIEHRWNGPTVEMVKPIAEEYDLDLKKPKDRKKADTLARELMALAKIPPGNTRVNCCNVRVQTNIRLGEGTPGYHQIKAIPDFEQVVDSQGVSKKEPGENKVHGSPNAFFKSLRGTWTSGERRSVVDHEAGHLLAERDKRDEKVLIDPKTKRKVYWDLGVHAGHELDIMGENKPAIKGVKWPMEATFRNALARAEIKCDCCPQYSPSPRRDDLWRDVHRWEDHLDYAQDACSETSLATALSELRRIENELVELNTALPWIDYQLLRLEVTKALERGGTGCEIHAENTGITVAVADTFGPEGLRVIPAPGVVIRVIDNRGREVASKTTENALAADFISLPPGEYTLRLNIGRYKPALPTQCTDGYVKNIELLQGEHKRFAASVYSATVAATGQSVGTVSGDCIREQ